VAWRMAQALETLHTEINAAAPERSRASDGGIGDTAHSSRASDHNPSPQGIVCARDWTHHPDGGLDGQQLADWLQRRAQAGERRIKYVIWNRQILSGPDERHACGVWRPYQGTNPHTKHLHLSVHHDHCDDVRPWGWPPTEEV
jgi:hypothetical protein